MILEVIAICSVILLLFLNSNIYEMPKIVWTHWDTHDLPEFCRKNLERTRRALPGWDVRFFTTAEFLQWCDPPAGFDDLIIQHKSDFMRLWLLKQHGGVWMDISIVLNTSIDELYNECRAQKAELSGFYLDGYTHDPQYPVFENWFIMAPRHSRIIALWYEEFCDAIRMGFAKYKQFARDVNFQGLLSKEDDVYLTQHLCFQRVIQQRTWRTPNILYKKAEDSMLSLQAKCKWDGDCLRSELRTPAARALPYIKLRGGERDFLPLSYWGP